jgi:hypothetical protein
MSNADCTSRVLQTIMQRSNSRDISRSAPSPRRHWPPSWSQSKFREQRSTLIGRRAASWRHLLPPFVGASASTRHNNRTCCSQKFQEWQLCKFSWGYGGDTGGVCWQSCVLRVPPLFSASRQSVLARRVCTAARALHFRRFPTYFLSDFPEDFIGCTIDRRTGEFLSVLGGCCRASAIYLCIGE